MTGINGSHHLQTDNTGARASSQKVLVQGKLYVCSLSFHTMNFLSSVTSARHDHPGQRVLKYFSRFQQQNASFEETLDLSQKENALQRELTARLPASLHGHHYEPILKTFRNYLTDRLMGIGLFPRPGEVIDKVSSMVVVWLAKSQRMRLCQCLGLVISTSVSGLSAGILELPLFFPGQIPITYSLHPIVIGEPLQTNLWCLTPDSLATGLVPSATQGVIGIVVHRFALNPIRQTCHRKPVSLVACPCQKVLQTCLYLLLMARWCCQSIQQFQRPVRRPASYFCPVIRSPVSPGIIEAG